MSTTEQRTRASLSHSRVWQARRYGGGVLGLVRLVILITWLTDNNTGGGIAIR